MFELVGVVVDSVRPEPESILQRVHPQDCERMRQLYQEAIRLGVPISADYRLLRTNGHERVLHDEVLPMVDASGAVVALRGTVQDITERHAIELAWRRSQEETRLILESTLDAVITIDAEGRVCNWNSRAQAIFGWTAKEVLGLPMHTLIVPKRMRDAHLQGMQSYRLTGEASILGRRIELPALHRQGHEITIEISISSLGVHGERRFSAFLRDISERKRAEAELRASEKRFQRVVENIGDALMIDDRDGRVIFANEQFCQMFGVPKEQLGVMEFKNYVAPECRALLRDRIERRIAGEQMPEFFEYVGLHADGRRLQLEARVKDIIENGECIGTQSALRDISERKRAEAALLALNESLERRIGERTAELSLAKDFAERASAAKTEFLSRMSHELRTPMNAVLGFSQLLRSDIDAPLNEEQASAVDEILIAGKHLLGLIDEILDLSRIESGRVDLEPESVDPELAISEIVRLLQPLAEHQQVQLRVVVDAGGATVLADRRRLRQVLINLLSNAIKYNRPGGSASVRCVRGEANMLRICVDDSGFGITNDNLQRLFHPFERLESAYSGIEGTGIGLTLCKHLVEAMLGRIGVESRVGDGSSFWFELPMTETVSEPAAALRLASGLSRTSAVVSQTSEFQRVLYVEDNPANLRLMRKLFVCRPQWKLLEAHDGTLALDVIKTQPVDLLMLDIGLPGMDGFDLLKQVRNVLSADELPAIAISANASGRDIERGLTAGFAAYLTKPFEVAKLLVCIDSLLNPMESTHP